MRRSLAIALAVALALGAAACGGVSGQDRDHPLAAGEVPYDLLDAPRSTTTEPPPPTTTTLPWRTNLWYIGGDRLVPAPRQLRDQPEVEQVLGLGQLVFTVTEVPGVGGVVFRIAGAELAVPLPNGQLAQRAVSRDDYAVLVFPG